MLAPYALTSNTFKLSIKRKKKKLFFFLFQVNLAVTVLLANVVVLLFVSDSLPPQSLHFPVICKFGSGAHNARQYTTLQSYLGQILVDGGCYVCTIAVKYVWC